MVQSHPGQIVCETLLNKTHHKKRASSGLRCRSWVQPQSYQKKQTTTETHEGMTKIPSSYQVLKSNHHNRNRKRTGDVVSVRAFWIACVRSSSIPSTAWWGRETDRHTDRDRQRERERLRVQHEYTLYIHTHCSGVANLLPREKPQYTL
jgi:hypothetical protein